MDHAVLVGLGAPFVGLRVQGIGVLEQVVGEKLADQVDADALFGGVVGGAAQAAMSR